MGESYQNTWLYFKCSGDAQELLEHNLPQPHHYERNTSTSYAVGWLVDGLFTTPKSVAYLNDIIARIALTVPITARYDFPPPVNRKDFKPLRLTAFQNAKSLRTDYVKQQVKHTNEMSKDMVWWAVKFQAESYIRQFGGWFDRDLLEVWAFSTFKIGVNKDVKDRSTLRAKCRGTWQWYEERGFKIPKRRRKSIMSREDAAKQARDTLAAETKAKVNRAVESMKFLQEKITVSGVARYAGVSRDTARKYLKQQGLI